MAGIEQDKLGAFYQLSRIAVLISDPAGVERHFCETLKRLVACNAALVFHYFVDKRSLIAANPYNPSQHGEQSIIISEDEPFFAEIILRRKSAVRQDCTTPLLPAMSSELFIPLYSPFELLGLLYVARLSPMRFAKEEIQFIEHAAVNLTFALERQSLRRQIERCRAEIFARQQSYLALLEAIPYPAVVVDSSTDYCNEANEAARRLFGAGEKDFIEKPFHSICRMEPKEGNTYSAFVAGEGRIEQYFVLLSPLNGLKQNLYLFLPPPAAEDTALRRNVMLLSSAPLSEEWSELVKSITMALELPIAICRKSDGSEWQTVAAFHPKTHETAFQPDDSLKELFERTLQMRDILWSSRGQEIDRAPTGAKFGNALPVAVLPLRQVPFAACMTFFAEEPLNRVIAESRFHLAAAVVTLKWLKNEADRAEETDCRASLLTNLMRLPATRSFKLLFSRLQKTLAEHLTFDFISFSLIEGETEIALALCTEKVQPFLPPSFELQPIADADWRWIVQHESVTEVLPAANYAGLLLALPAQYSTLLLDGQKYLGRMSIGRVKNVPFSRFEQQLVRDAAAALAAKLGGENANEPFGMRFSLVYRLLSAFKGDHWIEAWRKALADVLQEEGVRFAFVNDANPSDGFRLVLPEALGEKVSPEKVTAFLPEFVKDRAPLSLYTAADAVELFCRSDTPEPTPWHPVTLTPVLHDHRLRAVFAASAARREIPEEEWYELLTLISESLALLFPFEENLRAEFETGLRLSSAEAILQKLGGALRIGETDQD